MAFPEPQPRKQELPRKLLRSLDCKQGAVRAVRFNVDGNYCLTCGSDKSLKLWSPMRGTLLKTYSGHGYEVLDADGSCDNSHLTSCGSDKTVILWDVATVDGRVRRYDLRMGQLHSDFVDSPVTCVCFSKDGQCTLSSSLDSTLRLLDKDTGELLGEYKGHKNSRYKLECCLTEKDTHVVSCSEDGSGSLSLSVSVGKGVVQSLSFHPTEPRLLTASEGSIQLWGEESLVMEEEEGEGPA
ncbi:WD repeat domain-containing protein 83-like [Acipenser oxyrinchus oxyrinchus]|uniref:WD repeat domain-containing protein 83 n=1 Tax=Acipenser oxyrinchus oxyrinchus TaxID=40147 RepID=A0AAD8FU83_ACIOX|nr:WD repeat domain-containing protein 83-like [Acipenser oxyrinchus oxyrinchus]